MFLRTSFLIPYAILLHVIAQQGALDKKGNTMAQYITRTVNEYEAKAIVADMKTMQFVEVGPATYTDTAANATHARAALKEAGFDVPRGSQVESELKGSVLYRMTIDDFMAQAERVEESEGEVVAD